MRRFVIAVDFDGTIVRNRFPEIGEPVSGAIEWLQRFTTDGASLILLTARQGIRLSQAVDYCESNSVELWGVNKNNEQLGRPPKVYAHCYIDDLAVGVPIVRESGRKPFVDWGQVGPIVADMMKAHKRRELAWANKRFTKYSRKS